MENAFTGVLTRMSQSEQGEDEMVYVTKTGSVYHRSIACNHLKLSLRVVSIKELEEKRSFDGSIYYPCEKCCGGKNLSAKQNVVICNYGNRYHVEKSCQKISRSIREIPISKWTEEHHVKHVQMERSKKKNDNNRKYIVHMAVSFGGRGYSKGIIFGKKSSFNSNPF